VRVENGPSKIRGQRAKDFADRFVSFGGLGHGLMWGGAAWPTSELVAGLHGADCARGTGTPLLGLTKRRAPTSAAVRRASDLRQIAYRARRQGQS
jgi:hypothetical protein